MEDAEEGILAAHLAGVRFPSPCRTTTRAITIFQGDEGLRVAKEVTPELLQALGKAGEARAANFARSY